MTLQNFPRGGKKPFTKSPHSESIFHNKVKLTKNKRNRKKKNTEQSQADLNFVDTSAERLTNATLQEGLIVLGRICEVREYEMIISLPGGMNSRVLATDISQAYTYLLQNIIKEENDAPTEYKTLTELYNIGDYIVCYVKAGEPDGKWHVDLSLKPSLINGNVDRNYLTKGAKLVCTVTSREDHGYVVDTGIANTRAFIAFKHVDSGKQYFPGQQLLSVVKDINSEDNTSIIKLSMKQKKIDDAVIQEVQTLNNLIPGAKVALQVKSILPNGLQVTFGNNYTGYINQVYLDDDLSSYVEEMDIIGTLLYVLPTTKLSYFSLLTNKLEKQPYKPGAIIKSARVLYRESNGIVFYLHSGARGIVSFRRTDVNFAQIGAKFQPGTSHKCRVLAYSSMERLYVCTMERDILELKHFSCSDFTPGEIVSAKIVRVNQNTGHTVVTVDKVQGNIPPEHISDVGLNGLSKLAVGQQVRVRVLDVDSEENRVRFTLKESLVKSNYPVLSDISQAKAGSLHHGIVVKILKHGVLVRFFGNVKGFLPYPPSNDKSSDVKPSYSIGQTVLVRIESVDTDAEKLTLAVEAPDSFVKIEHSYNVGDCVKGVITDCSAEGVYLRISIAETYAETAFLPAGHMAPCPEVAAFLASRCTPGDIMSALVFSTMPDLLLTRTFVSQEQYRDFDMLKEGDMLPCSIRDVLADGLRVILPIKDYDTFAFIHLNKVSNFESMKPHQIIFAKIVGINKKDRQLTLTASLDKLCANSDGQNICMMAAVDSVTLYFNKLMELAANPYYKDRPISTVKLGQKVTGCVTKVTDYGLVLMLDNNVQATVRKDHYKNDCKVGDKVYGAIMWINYVHEYVDVTLMPDLTHRLSAKQDKLPKLPVDTPLRGELIMVTNWFILARLMGKGKGSLVALPARRHINDVQPNLKPYVTWTQFKCYVILNRGETDIMPIVMLKSAFETRENSVATDTKKKALKRKDKISDQENQVPVKKQKVEHVERAINVKPVPDKANAKQKVKKAEKIAENEPPKSKKPPKEELLYRTTDSKKDVQQAINQQKPTGEPSLPECGFFWDDQPDLGLMKKAESSSDSESETEAPTKQKKKKLNAAERRELERQKEREIREREQYLASNQLPNSVDQFDRLVLASPDSSLIWIQYMAHHLQTTEVEKARAVARRAVKTINFREENERLNVWNAWLNLESKFGSSESLEDVFHEALRMNDALQVYTHMLTVHVDAGRQVELEKLISTMLGKFRQIPKVWIDCGNALLKLGLKERSRHIMQRALQSLTSNHHVNVMVSFAQMENKLGDKERAQTLFEQILTSYPRRVDVWCSYVDALVKSGDTDMARKVLERSVVQTLPARKMKTLFKKFVSFEEQHGTPEGVAHVKQMAVEFVENQCHKESV